MLTRPDYLKYRVSGKLAKLLGRESVSTDVAALFELVKNAYDADAANVTITFEGIQILQDAIRALNLRYKKISTRIKLENGDLSPGEIDILTKKEPEYLAQLKHVEDLQNKTSISIEDDGTGMTLERLEEKWMVVGVDKEDREMVTRKGRRVVGEKGVGRFSTEKLAHITSITSYPAGMKHAIKLITNWDEFENSNKTISDVKVPVAYESKSESKHGLRIDLQNLRESWTLRKVKEFTDQLSLLVLPEEFEESSRFKIKIRFSKYGRNEDIDVESSILKKAPYRFITELTNDSVIKVVEAWYKGEKLYPSKIDVDIPNFKKEMEFRRAQSEESDSPSDSAKCGPAKFTFYGYPFDPEGRKLGWTQFYGRINLEDFRNRIKSISGVKIYRDGFRIRPYGDKDNDWLSIGKEARNVAGKLPNERVVGWVSISSETNKSIMDTTSREKIIENEAFEDLKSFVNQSLANYYKFAEGKRQDAIKKETLGELPVLIKKLGDSIIQDPSIRQQTKTMLVSNLNQIEMELTNKDEAAITEKESLMDERNAFRNLASLGITTGVVIHETKDFIRDIVAHMGILKRELAKDEPDKEKMNRSIAFIDPSVDNLVNYMSLIKGFTSSLGSRDKKFRKKSDIDLRSEINTMLSGLSGIFREWDIHPKNDLDKDLPKLRMFKADVQSVFLNLISNSIKSLRHFSQERKNLPDGKKNTIRISSEETKEDILIIFSDNGIGIPMRDHDYVFDLFWTSTSESDSVQSGSGLGLPIVKEIISDYKGTVSIDKKSEFTPGVTFRIKFPKKEIVK